VTSASCLLCMPWCWRGRCLHGREDALSGEERPVEERRRREEGGLVLCWNPVRAEKRKGAPAHASLPVLPPHAATAHLALLQAPLSHTHLALYSLFSSASPYWHCLPLLSISSSAFLSLSDLQQKEKSRHFGGGCPPLPLLGGICFCLYSASMMLRWLCHVCFC